VLVAGWHVPCERPGCSRRLSIPSTRSRTSSSCRCPRGGATSAARPGALRSRRATYGTSVGSHPSIRSSAPPRTLTDALAASGAEAKRAYVSLLVPSERAPAVLNIRATPTRVITRMSNVSSDPTKSNEA